MKASINFSEVLESIDNIKNKEIPYATSVGINDTAFQSKKALEKTIPKNLNLKSKWIGKQGVRIKKSHKSQTKIAANVYHEKEFMIDQEMGNDTSDQLVKTPEFRGKSARVPKKKYSSMLIAGYRGASAAGKQGGRGKRKKGRTKFFHGEYKGTEFIARGKKRRTKGAARNKTGHVKNGLIYAYLWSGKSTNKPKLNFNKTVAGVVKNRGALNIAKVLNKL